MNEIIILQSLVFIFGILYWCIKKELILPKLTFLHMKIRLSVGNLFLNIHLGRISYVMRNVQYHCLYYQIFLRIILTLYI